MSIEDEIPVGANQAGDIHIFVVDAKVIAFAYEPLDDLNYRALPQIVGAGFEAEAQYPNLLVSAFHNELQAPIHLHFVAGQDGGEDGQLQIIGLRLCKREPVDP